MRPLATALLSVLLLPHSATAATIHVPADQPTIQAGIDAAAVGDTVLVAPGTYAEPVQGGPFGPSMLRMKSGVRLIGQGGPSGTILRPAHAGRVIECIRASVGTSIEGLTLAGGRVSEQYPAGAGGALYVLGSDLVVRDCHVADNEAASGGGLRCDSTSIILVECSVERNRASRLDGGGIDCQLGCVAVLQHCDFEDNVAERWGGAAHLGDSFASITESRFERNSAALEGGGIYCSGLPGGEIGQCFFRDNISTTNGGAIFLESGSSPALTWDVFMLNVAPGWGGALYCRDSSPAIRQCTFYSNLGGGMAFEGNSFPVLENSICAFTRSGMGLFCLGDQPVVDICCCDFYHNDAGDWISCIEDRAGRDGNITADPLFCRWEGDDRSVAANSPCLPGQHPDGSACGLMGAYGEGCPEVPVESDVPSPPGCAATMGRLKMLFRDRQ